MKRNLTSGFEAWLELDGQYLVGRREVEILEQIRLQGSFMRAAKTLGISYAHAWNSVDKIQKALDVCLVEARRGGVSGGGGATLTEAGADLLKEYQRLQRRLLKAAARPNLSQREAELFEKKIELPDLTIIGSNSIGIYLIIEQMLDERRFSYEVVNVGSSGGLNALMLGEADIAGVHLADPETGRYNTPFLQRYWIAEKTVLVRGYRRRQGFIVKKGNPKHILSFRDLLRSDVKMINRGLGSGTRRLLDVNIQRLADEDAVDVKSLVRMMRGYDFEVSSHPEIARAVESGEADVGLGVEVRTVKMRFDFVPIQEEWFDFAVDVSKLKKPLVELFVKTLRSEKLRESVKARAPELKFTAETGSIIYQP